MTEFSLFAPDIDPECDWHDCEWGSTELYYGMSKDHEAGKIHCYMATYCSKHSAEHARDHDNLHFVGEIEPTND